MCDHDQPPWNPAELCPAVDQIKWEQNNIELRMSFDSKLFLYIIILVILFIIAHLITYNHKLHANLILI